MSLRKIAGLLVVFGLTVGLIGGGVGASFFDNVFANQPVQVGTFSCIISDGGGGVISPDQKSVTYSTVNILSSAPSSAPINFTVKNTGSIPQSLTVSTSSVSAPFSIINFPFAAVPLAVSATHTYNTGLQWGTLTNANLGTSGTVTWTVNCGEQPAPVTITSRNGTPFDFGPGGWAGWSCPAGATIVSVTANVTSGGPYTVGLARPGETTDGYTYPVYSHYTYTPPEQGGVIHNTDMGAGGQASITIVCQP
jgi:hypothetical protein